eukprot:CAMPEP_0181180554 /NCGR_PEP_ID=MMETSP1096-20121128/6863_1 /TAXON_ID=156174 ORGANISM="Chrysochromulina ericina, Strain CCMP281" /NCGR_SAMPLE_ID=MMETSP1096 /ASSEMBLY_ACC=CAM_ASM_000453 /LENGTH=97 /DNA_ID=CAMNT_0023268993 /DNA_START=1978 /DNA_END=2268 /DNA_ORIENTATION=-
MTSRRNQQSLLDRVNSQNVFCYHALGSDVAKPWCALTPRGGTFTNYKPLDDPSLIVRGGRCAYPVTADAIGWSGYYTKDEQPLAIVDDRVGLEEAGT